MKMEYKDEECMTKDEFYDFILRTFIVGGCMGRMIYDILSYVEETYTEKEKQHKVLKKLLDSLGLEDYEIEKVYMR